jgi:glycosyltransferase involved in cell wall biosynthesis
MTITWILELDPRYGIRHGALLRYVNLTRLLRAAGHRVYYLVNNNQPSQRESRKHCLEGLRRQGCFEDFFELEGPAIPLRRGLGRYFRVHPAPQDRKLEKARRGYVSAFEELLAKLEPDVCVVSDRRSLFLLPMFSHKLAMIADWCDSFVLTQVREIGFLRFSRQYRTLPFLIRRVVEAFAEERYYGRCAHANIVVSPVDKRYLDWVNGRPERNHVLRNGVAASPRPPGPRDPYRLIFTGSMAFPPNARGALWFIDHVLPRLLERRGDIRFVVAGQEPGPELLAKTGPHVEVTGWVPEVSAEIARSQLYVAPLFSGAGFRNKVVEALINGTYVIGTPMALECFEDRLRDNLLVASSAPEFAEKILQFMENPEAYEERRREAQRIVETEYAWSVRAKQLEALCAELVRETQVAGVGPHPGAGGSDHDH